MKWYALAAVLMAVFYFEPLNTPLLKIPAVLVAAFLAMNWIEEQLEFEPFTVRIHTTGALLDELAPDHVTRKSSGPGHSALRDGVAFTLLRPGIVSGRLVFWPDFASFSTKVETLVRLPELSQAPVGDVALARMTEWIPHLELAHKGEGVRIAVTRPGNSKADTIALLPWSVFGIRQWKHGVLPADKGHRLLEKLGWTQEAHSADMPGAPFRLSHRYLDVEWWYI